MQTIHIDSSRELIDNSQVFARWVKFKPSVRKPFCVRHTIYFDVISPYKQFVCVIGQRSCWRNKVGQQ